LQNWFDILNTDLKTESYKDVMWRTFVKAGQWPHTGEFNPYCSHKGGLMAAKEMGGRVDGKDVRDQWGSLAEATCELEMVPRPKWREYEDLTSESEGDSSFDEDEFL
jgi:hypothetical protein